MNYSNEEKETDELQCIRHEVRREMNKERMGDCWGFISIDASRIDDVMREVKNY